MRDHSSPGRQIPGNSRCDAAALEGSIADCFCNVRYGDRFRTGEVCDRSRDARDPVERACG
jgi:hypothetical protein